jgi:hypothetical protein
VLVALGALLPGCSRSPSASADTPSASTHAPPRESTAPQAPSAPAPPLATMSLLDAGRPPRRALRYAWSVARKEQLTMDLRTNVSTQLGGTKQSDVLLPAVRVAVAIDPERVSPEGDLDYRWQVVAADVPAGSAPPSAVADGMRAEVAAVAHLAGSARVSPRGLSLGVSVDPDSVVDSGVTGQMVEQVRETLRNVAAPLPDEPVGVGARWEKVTQMEARRTRIAQTETFTLVGLDGDRGTLDDVLAQTAPPQPLQGAAADAPAARLDSMLASGNSRIHFIQSRLVPRSHFDGTTTMVVSGGSENESPARLTMIMHIAMSVEGTAR